MSDLIAAIADAAVAKADAEAFRIKMQAADAAYNEARRNVEALVAAIVLKAYNASLAVTADGGDDAQAREAVHKSLVASIFAEEPK
jgi:hypothetical protein